MATMMELREHLPAEVLALPEAEQMMYLQRLLQQFRVLHFSAGCSLTHALGCSGLRDDST